MAGKRRRGLSAGTVLMLILTAVVLAGTAYVLLRLTEGHTVDWSKLTFQSAEHPADETYAIDSPAEGQS